MLGTLFSYRKKVPTVRTPLHKLWLTLVGISVAALMAFLWFTFHLLPGTSVGGVALGGKNKAQSENLLASIPVTRSVDLQVGSMPIVLSSQEMGISVDVEATYALLKKGQLASVLHTSKRIVRDPILKIDQSKLRQSLTPLFKTYARAPSNAELKIGTQSVAVTPEHTGTEYLLGPTSESITKAIFSGASSASASSQVVAAKVTSADLEASKQEISKIISTKISLVHDTDTFVLTPTKISQMLTYNDASKKVSLDPSAVAAYVKRLADNVDAEGTDEVHTLMDGRELSVSSGAEGQSLDQKATVATLTEDLQSATPATISLTVALVPFHVSHVSKKSVYGPVYIEVSIASQHLWVHQNGTVIFDSAVTTGAANNGDSTPLGVYHIYDKQANLYLNGPTWHDYVSYWIPFYGEYGLHDATWRAKFGTPDYASVGSHGCVNLPLASASWLYSWSSVGTKVVVAA